MGCGCKNKGQQATTAAEAAAIQRQQIQEQQKTQQESVKASVKKTIEKYYQAQKTSR